MICVKCGREIPEDAVFCHICGKKQIADQRKHKKRANGTGNISKLSGKRSKPYVARKNGISIGTFATRIEAQKALERLTDSTVNEKFNMTFAEIYEEWRPLQERKVSKTQMTCYTTAYNLCGDLHGRLFRKIRRSEFQNVIVQLERKGKSKSTCEKVRQLFSQISKWALAEEIIQVNHAQGLDTVAKQLSVRKTFTEEEIQKIAESTHRGADVVMILLSCGCRPNELFSVPLENCYDDYFIGGSKTEAGIDRPIVISKLGMDAYKKIRSQAIEKGGSNLIDGYEGNKDARNFQKREFKELMAEIGQEGMTLYCCRHTYITNAARAGVDQRALQQMVGHVDSSTTKIYTHLNVDDLREESRKIKTIAVGNKSATSQKEEN